MGKEPKAPKTPSEAKGPITDAKKSGSIDLRGKSLTGVPTEILKVHILMSTAVSSCR